ncbi:MAG TPA: hypothetical protein PKZ84_13180 [Anaerolineae bacterium]|nr:hypothetical protein [Anaerolineae bacterium]HQI85406.1 hypothetical protein [Anaerolineae bacterium]
MKNTSPAKFRLLPYQALAKQWLWPAMWLIPGGIFLWWIAPDLTLFDERYAFAGLGVAGVGALIVIYTFMARRAHVSCHKNNFVIHTPFYPVAFSYQRVEIIRPMDFKSIFPPEQEKSARRRLYKDIWGKTVVVINTKGYPLPLWWMRLWFHPYLIHPRERALVLPVEDWMGLSRSLETLRTNWYEAQRQRRQA